VRKLKEFVVYIFFGVLSTLVNMAVYQGLEWVLKPRWGGHSYLFSLPVAFIASLVFAFVVNKLFVFRQKSWERRLVLHEAWTFTAARLFSFGLEALLTFVFNDLVWPMADPWFTPNWLALWPRLGLLPGVLPEDGFRFLVRWGFTAVLVVIMNYFFSKWVVFRRPATAPPAQGDTPGPAGPPREGE